MLSSASLEDCAWTLWMISVRSTSACSTWFGTTRVCHRKCIWVLATFARSRTTLPSGWVCAWDIRDTNIVVKTLNQGGFNGGFSLVVDYGFMEWYEAGAISPQFKYHVCPAAGGSSWWNYYWGGTWPGNVGTHLGFLTGSGIIVSCLFGTVSYSSQHFAEYAPIQVLLCSWPEILSCFSGSVSVRYDNV